MPHMVKHLNRHGLKISGSWKASFKLRRYYSFYVRFLTDMEGMESVESY